MKVTYLGTTMLLFDDGKNQILFDCHVTRPSLLKCFVKSLHSDTAIVNKVIQDFHINRLRGIFISHTHHDHVLDAPNFASLCDCDVFGSPSAINIGLGNGLTSEKLHSYSDSMEYKIGDFHIQILPSIHSKPHWYNNDIGQAIDKPLPLPAPRGALKEGGSFDFLVTYQDKKYLIRPSYNYLEGQLNQIKADVLFLGITRMSKDTPKNREKFFGETIAKVTPKMVIPIHWDNFFTPLFRNGGHTPASSGNSKMAINLLKDYCDQHKIKCYVQLPLTEIELDEA